MNDIFQIHNFEFDLAELKSEIKEITQHYDWTQFGLQTDHKNTTNIGVDKKGIKYSQDSVGKAKSEEWEQSFIYPLFDAPIINSFIEHFKLHRTRLMIQEPRSVLTYHKDWTQRIHLPIDTHEDCMMLLRERAYHLEEGKVYFTNTIKRHTAFNCHNTIRRLHLVGCLPLNTRTWE
jgi:hypothetical protein